MTFKYSGTNPISEKLREGEPYFLVRAQDTLSVHAILAYAATLRKVGLNEAAQEVSALAVVFAEWQNDNPEYTKLPD